MFGALLLSLLVFHLPVTCDMAVPPPPHQNAVGVYHDAATPSIQLMPAVCEGLTEARAGLVSAWSTASLHVLAHELAHSYGIRNEAGADCVGGLLVEFVAFKLGAPASVGAQAWRLDAGWRQQSCEIWDQQDDSWEAR
jgi:hypothetical protein